MSYSSSTYTGSSYDDGQADIFAGIMICVFGTFICLFLIAILAVVCCICCRIKTHQNRVIVQPMNQLHYGTVAHATNHDQGQYIPSPNVQWVQRQQTLSTGPSFDRHTYLNSAPPQDMTVQPN